MDKKTKQHRQKVPTREELEEGTPPGASFNTEAGRAAQGMREDIAKGGGDTVPRDAAPPAPRDDRAATVAEDRPKFSPDAPPDAPP